jgi:hypothetical protein
VVLSQTLHFKGEAPFEVFISSAPGLVFLCAVVAFLVGSTDVMCRYLEHRRSPSRSFRLIVAMNVVAVVLTVVTAEIAVRAAVHDYYGYEAIGNLILKPKDWNAIKGHYQNLIRERSGDLSYYLFDPLLGWTIGPSRHSADGLYWSSSEGIRAPAEKDSFTKDTEETDIALVGDSYTFGEEGTFEESYGYHLEQMLGPQFRVLNFGVPGYGVDQMFLRYERDIPPWKPKIVILGFISDDVVRTLSIYTFLGNLRWDFPFARPRFILRQGELVSINTPLLTPDTIFSQGSISDLPFLEFQKEYRQDEWEKRFYHYSYLVRLLLSWHSPWTAGREETSEEALLSINAAILKEFVKSATQAGSIPLVLYLPVEGELNRPSSVSLAKRVLEAAGIAYIDATPCLLEVDPSNRFMSGSHYTSEGNAAIAECLLPVVHRAVRQITTAVGGGKIRKE